MEAVTKEIQGKLERERHILFGGEGIYCLPISSETARAWADACEEVVYQYGKIGLELHFQWFRLRQGRYEDTVTVRNYNYRGNYIALLSVLGRRLPADVRRHLMSYFC